MAVLLKGWVGSRYIDSHSGLRGAWIAICVWLTLCLASVGPSLRRRPAWPVIGSGAGQDDRRDARVLASVEGVLDELLQRDQRPLILAVAGLRDQLLARAEVEQPAGAEGGAPE